MQTFYKVDAVPVHSVLLMPTRERARNYRRGDIRLGLCDTCGFISNVAFDPTVHEYSVGYEATQSFSATFNSFHSKLAGRLIDRYDLHNKHLIEIGCGQGEFLIMLCEMGQNYGVGFDPAYDTGRPREYNPAQVSFVQDFYSEKYAAVQGDFIACKMTLEHIPNTAEFVRTVRRSIGNRLETVVFFQVPNARYVMRDVAFWDIYYEHCSYFSAGSLAYLFEHCGFQVLDVATEYQEQYLTIEAKPVALDQVTISPASRQAVAETQEDVQTFIAAYPGVLQRWRTLLEQIQQEGKRAVIWGSGSKGVAFLTTLNPPEVIQYAVDVNPYRHGTFMAGSGQEIVGPAFLQTYQPEMILVMNPIYCDEIQRELNRLGVSAQLIPV
jgi:2-polyprenyl-3-methyl-5-hydroxy-6-metoxy-1,4-benzoquinol methylase